MIPKSKMYNARFRGRMKGAIGRFYDINTTVSGINKEDAKLMLYDNYEHISFLRLTEIKEETYRHTITGSVYTK